MTQDNDLSPLTEASVMMHEMFLALVAAGFTEDQALRVIAYTVRPVIGEAGEG